MLHGVAKRHPSIEVRQAFHEVASQQQRRAHKAMPNHDRDCRLLLLGEYAELLRKLAVTRPAEVGLIVRALAECLQTAPAVLTEQPTANP